jgi:phosphoribosylformimino-5-aminoimidazole carboxamide ribotide isomerase
MLIIPAIDLFDSQAVRLYKGDYRQVKVYSHHPEELARRFEEAGARLIHIVDLDAAYGKGKNNRETIQRIRQNVSCELEVGGGIRSAADISELLAAGITRLILGTVLVKEPMQAASWIADYHFHAIGGIDALEGRVKISGWRGKTEVKDVTLAARLRSLGIKELIYTNISRDGTMHGPDIKRTNVVARYASLPVILSGGIASEDDIAELKEKAHENIHGVIVGKALYENKVDLEELVRKFQSYTDDTERY